MHVHDVRCAPVFLCVAFSSLLLAACVKTTATSTGPSSSPTTTASIQEQIVEMGSVAQTAAGNKVTVFSYLAPVTGTRSAGAGMMFAAADINACAGPHAAAGTGVTRSQFAVETPGTLWASVASEKSPALKGGTLEPSQCVRGWITFRVPLKPKGKYVVLVSRPFIKWRIP